MLRLRLVKATLYAGTLVLLGIGVVQTYTAVPVLLVGAILYSGGIALLGTGLTLAYMTTRVPNFAHGTISMIGLYLGLSSFRLWNSNPYAFIPIAFLLGGLAGLGLYLLVVRPLILRGASLVSLMIATIGFDLFLFSLINIYADYLTDTYGLLTRSFSLRDADFTLRSIGSITIDPPIPGVFIVVSVLVLLLSLSLHLSLTRTRFGVAMRATVENPALAGVVGINVNLIYTVSWIASGGLAGVAGLFLGLFLAGNPDLGSRLLPAIFAASIVGGLGNIYGALLGGYVVGIAEILVTFQLGSVFGSGVLVYQSLVPLAFIVIVLLVAPQGVTGVDRKLLAQRLSKATRESIRRVIRVIRHGSRVIHHGMRVIRHGFSR